MEWAWVWESGALEEVEVRRQPEEPEQREGQQRRWLEKLGSPVPVVRESG